MSQSNDTWNCASCGSVALASQNFCRICGEARPAQQHIRITGSAAGHDPGDASTRPLSRFGLVMIAALFLVLGGLAALIVDDIRGDVPVNPAQQPTTSTTPSRKVSPTTTGG